MIGKKQRSARTGSAMLEFAISWSVLWLLFASVYQFGYGLLLYSNLRTSVSNAALLASRMTYDQANPSAFIGSLRNVVVYGDLNAGGAPVAPGLTPHDVGVNVVTVNGFPQSVTVSINRYTINAIFRLIKLTRKPSATTVFMGQVVCSGC